MTVIVNPSLVRKRKDITSIVADAEPGTLVVMKLRPADHDCWSWGSEENSRVVDARGNNIPGRFLHVIVSRAQLVGTVIDNVDHDCMIGNNQVTRTVLRVELDGTDERMWVALDCVEAIRVEAPMPVVEVEGLEHPLEFQRDGSIKIGCRTITRAGAEQVHAALTEHLARFTSATKAQPKPKRQ